VQLSTSPRSRVARTYAMSCVVTLRRPLAPMYRCLDVPTEDREMSWGLCPCSPPYATPRHRPPFARCHASRDARTARLVCLQPGPAGHPTVSNRLSITPSSSSTHVMHHKTEPRRSSSLFPSAGHKHRRYLGNSFFQSNLLPPSSSTPSLGHALTSTAILLPALHHAGLGF
jgi:hypothetical protein